MKKVLSFSILIMLVGTVVGQSLTAKKEGKQWGFVNERDSFVVVPQYDAVGDFIGAYTWVNQGGKVKKNNLPVGGKWGLIDESAEQFRNWERFQRFDGAYPEALNLFAYSGLGSLALAKGGARVCHLDAARGMIEWGKENLALNPDIPPKVRWIVDDVNKFVKREVRRGARYNLIALDPPTFGRGSSGQLWKIEDDLPKLLEVCRELRDPARPFELVLSCHSPGFSVLVLERIVAQVFGRGEFESGEMFIPESTGRKLPAGVSVVYRTK